MRSRKRRREARHSEERVGVSQQTLHCHDTQPDTRASGRIAAIHTWWHEPPDVEVRAAIERLARAEDVVQVAIMPDVHLAAAICVGTVVATTQRILPQAIGGDIGCGMLAAPIGGSADLLRDERRARRLLDALREAVPTMRHRSLIGAPALPAELMQRELSTPTLRREAARGGRVELGTLGRGNHFVELQRDDDDRLWLMIHSGSRCMGQSINEMHTRAAQRAGGLLWFDADSDAGRAYLHDVEWARSFAAANRIEMARAVERALDDLFGVQLHWSELIHCDHNHVRRETHGGRALWVHRKGATPAADGEPGVIPGSMGTHSFHTLGRGAVQSLFSSSHGAGRRLSRSDARRRVSPRVLCEQLRGVHFDERLASRLTEEAPVAYKDVDVVMRAQRDLTRIVRRVWPMVVYKGG